MIERCYLSHLERLLERAENEGDGEGMAALRWAIFNLEMSYGGDLDPDTGEVLQDV